MSTASAESRARCAARFGFYVGLAVRHERKGIRAIRIDAKLLSERTPLGRARVRCSRVALTVSVTRPLYTRFQTNSRTARTARCANSCYSIPSHPSQWPGSPSGNRIFDDNFEAVSVVGTWRLRRVGRSWAARSTCHYDAFESHRGAAILHSRDRSSAAETPDGRFHNSIELGGRAALPEIGNGAALWMGDRAGRMARCTGPPVGIGREATISLSE